MSEKERGMSDVREALVALLHNEGDGGIWEHFDRKNSEAVADAILAEFDVTPRGGGADAELRAEVERLREDYQAACEARMMFHDELDEAQRQVADLRAGIERIRDALTAHIVGHGPMIDAEAPEADLTRLLAGSGEQSGERDATPDEAHDIGYSKGHADGYREAMAECRPAPVVPDSTDVQGELLHVLDSHGIDTYIDGTGAEVGVQNLITDILAVVGQGVAVEWGVGYGDRHEAAPSREDAEEWVADDDAWNPGEERWLVTRQVGPWTRAAVRPSGQEGS